MFIRICTIIAILAALIGCSGKSFELDDSSTIEVAGHVGNSRDGLFLKPCDIREVWRVEGATSEIEGMLKLLESNRDIAYVRVQGYKSISKRSDLQRVYDQLFTVTKVIEMRKATDDDCAGRIYPA